MNRRLSERVREHSHYIDVDDWADEIAQLERQRDALLEALKSALMVAEFEKHPFRPWHDIARAAIKSVEETHSNKRREPITEG